MLSSLHIKNVVLIDAVTLDLETGLSALTGETGAGKSILLDALSLAVGARSDSGLLKAGAEQALVSASFTLKPDHPVWALLQEQGLDVSAQDDLILRRTLGRDGRSKAFINDQPVQVTLLRDVGTLILEIHGQFATHALLQSATHRATLDAFAGQEDAVTRLGKAWDSWRAAKAARETLERDAAILAKEEEYLRASVDELTQLSPEPGEEEMLAERKTVLRSKGALMDALNTTLATLQDEDGGARPALLSGWRTLSRQSDKGGAHWDELVGTYDRIISEVQDLEGELQSLLYQLSEGGFDLETVEDRLYTLRAAARKYDCTVETLPDKAKELAAQLDLIGNGEARIGQAVAAENAAREVYAALAADIGAARGIAAKRLETLVATELPPLKLDKARFVAQVTPLDEQNWGPSGSEDVAFLLATHDAANPAPLAKVASGGELSRLMLAIRLVLAGTSPATTFIFDEVDTGIGGATAAAVGERLARLAANCQVLVVTHAPQVAAYAAQHLVVAKDSPNGQLQTNVTMLDSDEARRDEIARMLAGEEVTPEAQAAAVRLLAAGHHLSKSIAA